MSSRRSPRAMRPRGAGAASDVATLTHPAGCVRRRRAARADTVEDRRPRSCALPVLRRLLESRKPPASFREVFPCPPFPRSRAPVGRSASRSASGAGPPAATALFVLDGAVFGTWAARVPDVADRVGAGHGALGVALLCLSLGALVCMRVTGTLCARFGAGPVAATAGVAVSGSAVLPGFVSTVPALCAALFVFGGATGVVNVAANAVGVQVEARVGRPILSGLHAGFSFGGLAGALVGGAASSVLDVPAHLVLTAAAGLFVSAWVLPALAGADRGTASAAAE